MQNNGRNEVNSITIEIKQKKERKRNTINIELIIIHHRQTMYLYTLSPAEYIDYNR